MRDDLHKKAPIPRKAQTVLKLALREADRMHPDRLIAAARGAFKEFVAVNFAPATVQALASAQGEFFGMIRIAAQARSPAESEVLSNLSANASLYGAQTCLESALQEVCDSYIRETRATLIAERVSEVGVVIKAFGSALYAGASDIARAICAGEVANEATPPLSLGENLLGTKKGMK